MTKIIKMINLRPLNAENAASLGFKGAPGAPLHGSARLRPFKREGET